MSPARRVTVLVAEDDDAVRDALAAAPEARARGVPEVIKLHQSLVSAIDGDGGAQALASGIVGFAERIGASVVAEGIERRAQLHTLVELGVKHGQGYCFARPGPLPLRPRPGPRRRAAVPIRPG